MRYVPLMVLFGCGSETVLPWQPETPWSNETVEAFEVLAEGLNEPRGIVALSEGGWAVAERGGGRLLHISEEGAMEVLHDGLDGPWAIVELEPSVFLVSERDGGQVVLLDSDGTRIVLNAELTAPTEFSATAEQVYFIDEEAGELWATDLTDVSLVASGLSTPTGLATTDSMVYIAESGSSDRIRIWDEAGEGTLDNHFAGVDVPYDVAVRGTEVFFTGRSLRWPYGGWVYGGSDGKASTVCESTPGADRIVLDGDTVIWSTFESILSCSTDGPPFEMVAPETSVGELVADNGYVIWTDKQRGAVYRTKLSD